MQRFFKGHESGCPRRTEGVGTAKYKFIKTTFIKNHFHQKTTFIRPLPVRGTHHPSTQRSPCLCASWAEGRDAFTQTRLMPTFGVSAGLSVEHCRPKAGNVQQKGPLRVQRWVFRF